MNIGTARIKHKMATIKAVKRYNRSVGCWDGFNITNWLLDQSYNEIN